MHVQQKALGGPRVPVAAEGGDHAVDHRLVRPHGDTVVDQRAANGFTGVVEHLDPPEVEPEWRIDGIVSYP